MVDSFTIEFKFTDIPKVYGLENKLTAKWHREEFFRSLLLSIWKINSGLVDGYFPLHKIIVETNGDHDLPSIEMSMPELIMKTFEEED